MSKNREICKGWIGIDRGGGLRYINYLQSSINGYENEKKCFHL